MLVFISAFRTRFSFSLVTFNPQQFVRNAFGDVVVSWPLLLTMIHDNQGSWLVKYSATVVVGVAVATFIWRRACIRRKERRRIHDYPHDVRTAEEASTSQNSELKYCCGLPAKLRISRTFRNPYRLFYNCPKNAFHHVSSPYKSQLPHLCSFT